MCLEGILSISESLIEAYSQLRVESVCQFCSSKLSIGCHASFHQSLKMTRTIQMHNNAFPEEQNMTESRTTLKFHRIDLGTTSYMAMNDGANTAVITKQRGVEFTASPSSVSLYLCGVDGASSSAWDGLLGEVFFSLCRFSELLFPALLCRECLWEGSSLLGIRLNLELASWSPYSGDLYWHLKWEPIYSWSTVQSPCSTSNAYM